MTSSLGQPLDGMPVGDVPLDAARFASDFRFGGADGEGLGPVVPAISVSLDGAAPRSAGSGGVRVLLVDDHEDMLSLMKMMLERRCYHVETALSGEEALQRAAEFGPQVVVSDIAMPGMDGYELMQALRALDTLAPFKSIALSGYDARDEELRARAAGYDTQLTKPVDFESLSKAIDALSVKG